MASKSSDRTTCVEGKGLTEELTKHASSTQLGWRFERFPQPSPTCS
jgi:hypothetical protein